METESQSVPIDKLAAAPVAVKQGDLYSDRARPTFAYAIVAILAFDYIAIPLAQMAGSSVHPIQLPSDLLTLFGVYLTGYGLSRSAEKIASLPGDSQMSVLGIRIGNKQ